MNDVIGTTAILGRASHDGPVHRIQFADNEYSPEFLAGLDRADPRSVAAQAPVLFCLECGLPFSAVELYLQSPTAGECVSCATEAYRQMDSQAGRCA